MDEKHPVPTEIELLKFIRRPESGRRRAKGLNIFLSMGLSKLIFKVYGNVIFTRSKNLKVKKLKETYDTSIFRNTSVFWTLNIQICRRWKIFKLSLFSNPNGEHKSTDCKS
jgi:hypothetical protein